VYTYPTTLATYTDIDKNMTALTGVAEFALGDRGVLYLKAVGGAATVRIHRRGGGGYYPDVAFDTITMAANSIWAVFNSPRYGGIVKVEKVSGDVRFKALAK
jgi:hypothetical protein